MLSKIQRQVITEVLMTPTLAKEYLEKYANEAQRPIKNHRIKGHSKRIQDGHFLSSQIVIGCWYENEDHRTNPMKAFLDGHHRLYGIIDANIPVKLEVNKVTASKETIRQLYTYFDSKKSARSLGDILFWKVAFHPELVNRWNKKHLLTLALALPYASGHYFVRPPLGPKFPNNCLEKGTVMGKDDFLSNCLDSQSWWFALDTLNEFLNDLSDKTENVGTIKSNGLGNIVFGVFLNSFESLSNRGRRGEAFNKTMEFWNEYVDCLINPHIPHNPIIKKLRKLSIDIKLTTEGTSDGTVVPIFYAFSHAMKQWKQSKNCLNLGKVTVLHKKEIDVINDFYGKGEYLKDIHPKFKQNRYWEKKLLNR